MVGLNHTVPSSRLNHAFYTTCGIDPGTFSPLFPPGSQCWNTQSMVNENFSKALNCRVYHQHLGCRYFCNSSCHCAAYLKGLRLIATTIIVQRCFLLSRLLGCSVEQGGSGDQLFCVCAILINMRIQVCWLNLST